MRILKTVQSARKTAKSHIRDPGGCGSSSSVVVGWGTVETLLKVKVKVKVTFKVIKSQNLCIQRSRSPKVKVK